MAWDQDTVPRHAERIEWRESGDEIHVFAADGESVHTLSAVAADIWRACDGRNSVGDIAELILAAYEVERQRALADLQDCLDALEAKGLIVRS